MKISITQCGVDLSVVDGIVKTYIANADWREKRHQCVIIRNLRSSRSFAVWGPINHIRVVESQP